MSNTNEHTRTFYNVIINRFSNVSNDLATFLAVYDNKKQAEQYSNELLSRNQFDTLRFAVTIIPTTITCPGIRYALMSGHMGYVDAKFDVKTSAVNPISITTQK